MSDAVTAGIVGPSQPPAGHAEGSIFFFARSANPFTSSAIEAAMAKQGLVSAGPPVVLGDPIEESPDGWEAVDWCGNTIGWVPDGHEGPVTSLEKNREGYLKALALVPSMARHFDKPGALGEAALSD